MLDLIQGIYSSVLGFENVGSKIKKFAVVCSIICTVFGILFAGLCCIGVVVSLVVGMGIGQTLLFALLIIIDFITMIFWHVPLWFIYAFGDIHASVCKTQNDEVNTSNNVEYKYVSI